MSLIETIRLKLRRFYIHRTARWRRKEIQNTDWTIISNNCWGGFIYQSYGLPYNTPTIGGFFVAEDYLEFISDLEGWIAEPLQFLASEESRYAEHYKDWEKFGTYPIGCLKKDGKMVEIHFMHYSTEEETLKHWNDRIKRMNLKKVLYKFNDQNLCTEEHLKRFAEMPLKHKICFTSKEYHLPDTLYIRCPKSPNGVAASFEPFGRSKYININELLNELA